MLDRTIVNVLRRRNMSPEQQRRAPKWQQVVNTVDWLTTQIQPGTNVQVIGFNDKATWLIPGTEGKWVTVNDGSELDAPVETLRASHPQGPTSLHAAFNAIKTLEPKPDNIYLLDRRVADDGRDPADASRRQREGAVRSLQSRGAAAAGRGSRQYAFCSRWKATRRRRRPIGSLAIRTGGSMLAPSEDWP